MKRKDAYLNALQNTLSNSAPIPTTRNREQIERDITEITEMLKGPLSNVERLCLVEDRQHLRRQLASIAMTAQDDHSGGPS